MRPVALDLQVDGVRVICKQETCDQPEHPACDERSIPSSSDDADERRDDVT